MSSPGVKIKRTMKICRECSKQVPTASKSCSCGFAFIVKRTSTETTETGASEGSAAGGSGVSGTEDVHHRRTQRTRRGRPHFFDSLEYGPRFNKKRSLTSSGLLDHHGTGGSAGKHRRGLQHTPSIKPTTSTGKSNLMHGLTSSHLLNKSPTTPGSGGDPTTSGRHGSAKKDTSSNGSSSTGNDDDVYTDLSPEKMLQYSTVLAEINRKCTAVNFRPR